MGAMTRRSPFTRFLAPCLALALAYAQVAMAAFAPAAHAPQMQASMAEGGCHGMDPAAKHVCIKTCQDEAQKAESPSLAALPPALDAGLRIELAVPSCGVSIVRPRSLIARATSPPLHLVLSRLLQ